MRNRLVSGEFQCAEIEGNSSRPPRSVPVSPMYSSAAIRSIRFVMYHASRHICRSRTESLPVKTFEHTGIGRRYTLYCH